MKKNYIIPYGERFTSIGKHPYNRSIMSVDNVGVVVAHEKDYTPTDDDLRRHLIGWSEQREQFLQAESLEDAMKEFMSYPECNTGIKHKAWEPLHSQHKPVKEYAGCPHMRITKGGSIACGYFDEPTDGGHMVCVLSGLDEPPLCCPLSRFTALFG